MIETCRGFTAIIVRDHEVLKIDSLISRQIGECLCSITTLKFMMNKIV